MEAIDWFATTRWKSSLISLVFAFVAFESQAYCEEFTGDPELLKLVAVQCRLNVDAIETWHGVVEVIEHRTEGSGEERRYASSVDFAYDRFLDAKRWRWNCYDFKIIKDGTEQQTEVGLMSGMLKDNAFYRLGPVPSSSQSRKVVVIRGENEFAFGPESVDFDPLYCYTSLGEPAYVRFEGLYGLAKNGGATSWTISRDGDLVSLSSTSEMSGGGTVVNRYVIDLAKGSNIVSYSSTDPWVNMDYEYEFKNVSGVWVPSRHKYHRGAVAGTTYTRSMDWTKNVVNEPSEPNLFSIESLGVKDGDRVKDSRSGTDYTIGGREAAIKASKSRSEQATQPARFSLSRPLMIVAFLALLILIYFQAFSRKR